MKGAEPITLKRMSELRLLEDLLAMVDMNKTPFFLQKLRAIGGFHSCFCCMPRAVARKGVILMDLLAGLPSA
jgi:hypothetical protein